jgi:hypothetical protein
MYVEKAREAIRNPEIISSEDLVSLMPGTKHPA